MKKIDPDVLSAVIHEVPRIMRGVPVLGHIGSHVAQTVHLIGVVIGNPRILLAGEVHILGIDPREVGQGGIVDHLWQRLVPVPFRERHQRDPGCKERVVCGGG